MDKLILIDGNSLLNRAYYAMGVFTTQDGLPTNGIFGFIKLVIKLIEDEHPTHLAVAFDLRAPTFRHKMYDGYKATRKPMPEDLARQVPVLKELLAAMDIRMVEMEGYEADDIIGTLSRKFSNTDVYIYTGDRDSYQLVKDHVSVCFTRRGVSDIELLTAQNFHEKVGLEPWQIIEEKSLMGDSSDNIPGIYGIGPKSAMGLLERFGSLDEIYRNLDQVQPTTLRRKLEEGEQSARLSHTLATIDTNVPIDVTLESCLLCFPFPDKARAFFERLEFRSLLKAAYFEERKAESNLVEIVECSDIEHISALLGDVGEFAFTSEQNECHIYFGKKEYIFAIRNDFLEPGFFWQDLKPLFESLFTGKRHALVPDVKALLHLLDGLNVDLACPIEDVTLLRYLVDSNDRRMGAKDFINEFALPERNCAYSVKLAYDAAAEKINGSAEEKLYRELELPLVFVLHDMERTGIRVDMEKFPVFSDKFNRELNELSKQIYQAAGSVFNINSPVQLSDVLFNKLGYDTRGIKKSARGGYSTNAEVLEKLARDHEVARLILRYREIQKLQSTYVEGIRPLVTGGIVHTTYNQTMTTTGRLSSANPNLQNIPVRTEEGRELRQMFIAREGNVLIDADYSQIELRLLAHFSRCKALIQAYQDGADIHSATAASVFGTELSAVTQSMRRRAKTINFGIIYGMSGFGLAKDLGCSPAEAQDYINRYFAMYPEVKEYMNGNVCAAKEKGYVTTILGRKRYIGEIASSNFNIRAFGERAAMNMPLQGSAADIIKIAMLRVADRLKREGLRAKMVLQVHDELVLDAPEEEAERAAKLLKEEMENAIELEVPLIAEVSMGRSWYDAK